MYWVNCSNCGKRILSQTLRPKLCSVCRREAEREKRLASKRVCPVCGKEFIPKYPHQINCSQKCALRARTTSLPRKCDNCHRNIMVAPSNVKKHQRHFCSRKCYLAYLKKHRGGNRVGVSERLKEKVLEKYDKFLRAGITRTDIDSILAEWLERGISPSPEQLVEEENVIRARYEKLKKNFSERISFVGPDCGLGSWPSQEIAHLLLKRTVAAVKRLPAQ